MSGKQFLISLTKRAIIKNHFYQSTRGYAANKIPSYSKTVKRIESVGTSLSTKGFLRSTKSYRPPENVAEKISTVCKSLKLSNDKNYELVSLDIKFKTLAACNEIFRHSVPNSQIHEIKTIGDVIQFYETSIDTTVPLDAMKNMELPKNLHIQVDYLRFNPETDTKFKGQTAFPKSSTLVTGLKYRNKYPGSIAKRSWP